MSELRESLDEALRTVIVGDPPVEEAIRRGKAIRMRRRAGVTAAVGAVAIIVGAGYPALAHWQAAPEPATSTHRHAGVTDVPPGPGARAGAIASGTIDSRSWQVYRDNQMAPGQQCVVASGPAFGPSTQPLSMCGPPESSHTTGPVDFGGLSADGQAQASFGAVWSDVSYVQVRLSDGAVLKLIPVKVYGTRYVAFASPPSLAVTSATAYLSDGRHLTAIPFNAPDGSPVFGLWLSPGQPVPPRVTKLIAAGSADGTAGAVRAYAGPWGACFVYTSLIGCAQDTGSMGTRVDLAAGGSPGVVVGTAAAGVRYLTVEMTDGRTLRVTPVLVGGQRYFVFFLDKGQQTVRRWTAYDAAGRPLSSGKPN